MTRSAINQQAGAVSQWSGVISAVGVAVIMLVAAPYAYHLPRSGRMVLTQFVVSSAHGHTHERLPEDHPCDLISICGLDGELFFGATAAPEQHFETKEAAVTDKTQVMVLWLKRSRNPVCLLDNRGTMLCLPESNGRSQVLVARSADTYIPTHVGQKASLSAQPLA